MPTWSEISVFWGEFLSMSTPNEFSQWDEFSDASPPPSPGSGNQLDPSQTIKYSSCSAKHPTSKQAEDYFCYPSETKYRSDMCNALKAYEESFDQVRIMKRVLYREGS
ncbi:hypothetical protein N7466_006300 [Penicillium verhagenii]|uniref:uncharacterized protein n=1 Tax=Penicillium verhagenii TaxID=1562060 RepID=UPI0025451EB3|nr:uncharacterized protein N7466_006300 [Penicillium verhagenii]KAJ5930807.1 hypothetical protein N7466_006300 [Penicillium verhagenii]